MKRFVWLLPALYILFLLMPIYWLLNMSFKNTNEILGSFTLWPRVFTLENYRKIFTDPTWYGGYLNSLGYVLMNTVTSVVVALPAAYAFSRYRFLGDKHLFFWLLTNRMAPPAVFALPFYQLYSAVNLFDTPWAVALAHTLFNIPLAVWILEGFMSGVPKELDETAYVDGYSFWRFFSSGGRAMQGTSLTDWMAWTWQTAAFFGFIVLCLVAMSVWEVYSPGGGPRRGILRLDTTRGDRLFISLLGSAFIFLAWLGL